MNFDLSNSTIDKIGMVTVGSFSLDAVINAVRSGMALPLSSMTLTEGVVQIAMKAIDNIAGIVGAVGVILIYHWLHVYRMSKLQNDQAYRLAKLNSHCQCLNTSEIGDAEAADMAQSEKSTQ